MDMDHVHLLSLIAATDTTPTAFVAPEQVEDAGDACITAWCRRNGVASAEVQRICTLYLKPVREGDTMQEWLEPG